MKAFWTVWLCLLAALMPANAAEPFPTDGHAVSRWMTYYYVEKNVDQVGDFLRWLQTSRFLDDQANAELPTTSFIAAVFGENPDRVREWATVVPFTGKAKTAIERSLWLSHHSDLISDVLHDSTDYASSQPQPLLSLPLTSPGMFDIMWATFFATGNIEYPRRLIDLLDDSVPISGDKKIDAIYRESVSWSLSSNMHQHELILRMVKSESTLRTGQVQQKLKEMLAAFEAERKPLPNCNGEFCAMLVLVPEDNLKEFAKPSDQGVFLTQLSKAKAGDHIAIKIVFAGMELGSDLSADVSYDVRITAPDGTLYTKEQQGLEALKRKVPLRFSMFDNGVLPIVRFEPKDARGAYTVSAEISDNIGHRKIDLSQRIELTD